MFGNRPISTAPLSSLVDEGVTGSFLLVGSSDLDWIGTTDFADLIESGTELMTVAAEIHLRSL